MSYSGSTLININQAFIVGSNALGVGYNITFGNPPVILEWSFNFTSLSDFSSNVSGSVSVMGGFYAAGTGSAGSLNSESQLETLGPYNPIYADPALASGSWTVDLGADTNFPQNNLAIGDVPATGQRTANEFYVTPQNPPNTPGWDVTEVDFSLSGVTISSAGVLSGTYTITGAEAGQLVGGVWENITPLSVSGNISGKFSGQLTSTTPTLNVTGPASSLVEGSSGTVQISLSGPLGSGDVYNFTVQSSDGTAAAGINYNSINTTVTLNAANNWTASIPIQTLVDNQDVSSVNSGDPMLLFSVTVTQAGTDAVMVSNAPATVNISETGIPQADTWTPTPVGNGVYLGGPQFNSTVDGTGQIVSWSLVSPPPPGTVASSWVGGLDAVSLQKAMAKGFAGALLNAVLSLAPQPVQDIFKSLGSAQTAIKIYNATTTLA